MYTKSMPPLLGAPRPSITPPEASQPIYVHDVYGSLVRLTGRDILFDQGDKHYARVLACDPHEFGSMFVLHRGTIAECHRYIKAVGDSLVVIYVEDVESTRAPEDEFDGGLEQEVAF
jgi:hypothetical protein